MKLVVLYILKFVGAFWLCRKLVSKKTLILAYHGFETIDESEFRDKLFITRSQFRSRLNYLSKYCTVVPFGSLQDRSDKKNRVVITIDDGWDSIRTVADPYFKKYKFDYTIYVTTKNVIDNEPIFHIALDYILNKNIGNTLVLESENHTSIDAVISGGNLREITSKVEALKSKDNDTNLLLQIATSLDFDFQRIVDLKSLALMDKHGIQELHERGVDIQLHTHTHNTPLDDFEKYKYEIETNRNIIQGMIDAVPEHHCYPSGSYNENCFGYLLRLGVKTATTCKPGFCDADTNPYELPRFLDGANIPQIVFEAEVSGLAEMLRKARAKLVA